MKQYKLTITMPDDFQTGECCKCPLGVDIFHTLHDCDWCCVMHYCSCDCPLHEGQAIEEDYTD